MNQIEINKANGTKGWLIKILSKDLRDNQLVYFTPSQMKELKEKIAKLEI